MWLPSLTVPLTAAPAPSLTVPAAPLAPSLKSTKYARSAYFVDFPRMSGPKRSDAAEFPRQRERERPQGEAEGVTAAAPLYIYNP